MAVTILDSLADVSGGYTASSGSNRIALFYAGARHGSSNAVSITSLTVGGQSCTKLFDGGTNSRVSVSSWYLIESQIAAISGSTVTPSGGTYDVLYIDGLTYQDASQNTPTFNGASINTGTTSGTLSLSRADSSETSYYVLSALNSNDTLGNPTSTFTPVGYVTAGVQSEASSGTSDCTYSGGNAFRSHAAVNVESASSSQNINLTGVASTLAFGDPKVCRQYTVTTPDTTDQSLFYLYTGGPVVSGDLFQLFDATFSNTTSNGTGYIQQSTNGVFEARVFDTSEGTWGSWQSYEVADVSLVGVASTLAFGSHSISLDNITITFISVESSLQFGTSSFSTTSLKNIVKNIIKDIVKDIIKVI